MALSAPPAAAQGFDPTAPVRNLEYEGRAYPIRLMLDRIAVFYPEGLAPASREAVVRRLGPLIQPEPIVTATAHRMEIYGAARPLDAAALVSAIAELRSEPAVARAAPVYASGGKMAILLDRLFVQLRDGVPEERLRALLAPLNLTILVKTSWREGNYVLQIPADGSTDAIAAAEALREYEEIVYAEPDLMGEGPGLDAPDDPLFPQQWNLDNVGQQPTWKTDADLDYPEGREIVRASLAVTIAVLDDGFEMNHPDYQLNLDRVNAKDFVDGDSIPSPSPGDNHGTNCLGIAAAIAGNQVGIAGVAGGARILPIRVWGDGFYSPQAMADGIAWAMTKGASVISDSWHTINDIPSWQIAAAIREAVTKGRGGRGCVVVFAAGNADAMQLAWPAQLEDVISVGATNFCDQRKSMVPMSCDNAPGWGSCYGPGLDVAAPGVFIPTTTTGGGYRLDFEGTSAAAPHVAGLAALLLRVFPTYQATEIRARIEETCDKVGNYNYHPTTGISPELGHGRINIYRAVSGKPQVVLGPLPENPSVYRDDGDATGYPPARHDTSAYEWLGTEVSPENGQADPKDPDGATNNAGGDAFDDGVAFHPPYMPGQPGTIDVHLKVENSNSPRYVGHVLKLNVWFDWNSDNVWDAGDDWVIRNKEYSPSIWGISIWDDTIPFVVPENGWHVQNRQDGLFLNVRARLTYDQALNSPADSALAGEVEDYRFVNFVEMFDEGPNTMRIVSAGCNPWEHVNGQAPWEPNPCAPPFTADAPPNGYMAACIYSPNYQGDASDQLRTPSFDLTEMTQAMLVFEHSAIEQIWGRVMLYNGPLPLDTLAVYQGTAAAPPPCGLATSESFDISAYCGPGFSDVYVAFEVAHDEPCGIPFPSYQDWFIDSVRLWAQDLIAPAAVTVTVAPTGPNSQSVTWVAPGDDGNAHRAQLYNVRYGPVAINSANWRRSLWLRPDMVPALPVPADPGTVESITVNRMSPGQHHFSVRTLDEVTNIAPITEGGTNHPPIQNVQGPSQVDYLTIVDIHVTANDPDFDPVFLLAPVLPEGAEYEDHGNGSGDFHWLADQLGSIHVVFEARDWNGAVDVDTVSIRVLPTNVAPDDDDHDVGTAMLTVTNQGILGFLDATQAEGSGFVYPRTGGSNHLYIGGVWVGTDSTYVAARDYDADPHKSWVATDSVRTDPYGYSTQDFSTSYTDAGAAEARGIEVSQSSWAYSGPPSDDDFIIMRYRLTNRGGTDQSGLRLGLFADFDVDLRGTDDRAGTDAARGLAWATDPSGVYVGVRLLIPPVGSLPLSNLTLIDNATYVHPNQYILDADKVAFLAASDAAHVLTDGPTPKDYGVLVSAGPFDLARMDQREVAFAVIGGSSLAELQQNADRAQLVYEAKSAGADEPSTDLITRLLPNAPNPFGEQTIVRFSLARPAETRVLVYDVGGRVVRRLVEGSRPAGEQAVVWDGRDERGRPAAAGVYFLRLRSGGREESRRILRLH
jgi:hypothetical protein